MSKSSTIRKWSGGRKRRVFRGRTYKQTVDLIRSVDVSDVLGEFNRREARIVAREISRAILDVYTSEAFLAVAGRYEDCDRPEDIANLDAIEKSVMSSPIVKEYCEST